MTVDCSDLRLQAGGRSTCVSTNTLGATRRVTFGSNHQTRNQLGQGATNQFALKPCDKIGPQYCALADAYVLAREEGIPLVLAEDNLFPLVQAGVKFRRVVMERRRRGQTTRESLLRVIDSPNVLMMERGGEGFFW